MKRLYVVLIIMIVGLLAAGCAGAIGGGPPAAAPASQPNTLTAVKVDAVSLDANADYWNKAPKLAIDAKAAMEGNPDGPTVTLQAVYDNAAIAIRAEWADDTETLLKNAWTWDGSAFTKSGDEDRVMFAWPIGNNAEFSSKGCAAACHNTAENYEEWWMGSDNESVRYDNWHWKSARTNAAGYADDQWWNVLADPTNFESSRRNDAKESGGYADNVNDEKSGPRYMSKNGADAQLIMAGEEVELDLTALAAGDVIPGYVLSKAVGSRGDVEANGVWADGKWVVVLRRALDTGHDDDAVFTVGKPMPFGVSVVDNGGGVDHATSPEVLTLQWNN